MILCSGCHKKFDGIKAMGNISNVCAENIFAHKEIYLSISIRADNKKRSLFAEFNKKRDWLGQYKRSPSQVSRFHHGVYSLNCK